MRKLTIVFHDGGGGHRNAANALKQALAAQEKPWDVTLLNLQELLDSIDIIHRLTGLRVQEAYNLILRKGWTRFTPQLLKGLQQIIRLRHRQIASELRAYWLQHPADLVLSVIPHFNRPLARSLKTCSPKPPFVTLITDLADYPPHFWIERESEYIIVGTGRAKQQALEIGHPAAHIFQVSGMVLKPKFYGTVTLDPASERRRLGLQPNCPTGIVLFGGHGSRAMLDIVKQLDGIEADLQLILLCGHNHELASDLRMLRTKKAVRVEGFTSNVEYFMALSDFFIGKPGPGSISEALQFHLPVIVERNANTLPQERYNAEWIIENGFGIVVGNFRQIAPAVAHLLQTSALNEFRSRTGAYRNRALFEVPLALEQCYAQKEAPEYAPPAALPEALLPVAG